MTLLTSASPISQPSCAGAMMRYLRVAISLIVSLTSYQTLESLDVAMCEPSLRTTSLGWTMKIMAMKKALACRIIKTMYTALDTPTGWVSWMFKLSEMELPTMAPKLRSIH